MAAAPRVTSIRDRERVRMTNTVPQTSLTTQSLAPDFTLPEVRGGTVSLASELAQHRAVIVFYRGGWCPICNHQLAQLSAAHEEFRARGAQVLAISNDVVRKGADALAGVGPPYPVLVDAESHVIRHYGLVIAGPRDPLGWALGKRAYAHPAVVIVDRQGRVAWTYRGRNYRDRPKVRAILEALDRG